MNGKKSQIAVFIIIGIIIIAALIFFLSSRSELTKMAGSKEKPETGAIQNYVESCINSVGEDAILFVSRQGGYFELPELSTDDFFYSTSYYFYIDRNLMPSQTIVEQELSKYVNEELFFCLRNFADFSGASITADTSSIKTTSFISANNVLFKVSLPVTINSGGAKTTIDSFSANVENVRLKTVYNVSNAIMEEQMKNFDSICISCILRLAIENDVYVDIQRLENDTMLFNIYDNRSRLSQPLEYIFANKYNISETANE